jgi:hypothetical protein
MNVYPEENEAMIPKTGKPFLKETKGNSVSAWAM